MPPEWFTIALRYTGIADEMKAATDKVCVQEFLTTAIGRRQLNV